MDIKVVGTGCAHCKNTIARLEQVAQEKGVALTWDKVEELREIMGYDGAVFNTVAPGTELPGVLHRQVSP